MSTFVVTFDVEGHDHSLRAHRVEIGTFLDQVKQAVGATEQAEGIITRNEPFKQTPIGSWKIIDDETEKDSTNG
ncbi:hypothetical protein ABIB99_001906 [Bradyrhizobium sp. LA6.1]|uniref:hypothetical protein n=1 Tax=Bradyrhizobium sp. LA6.1 TaxID=3156378 RepID=UPI0033973CC4